VAITQIDNQTFSDSSISSTQGTVIDNVFLFGYNVCRFLIEYAAAVLHATITICAQLSKNQFSASNVIFCISSQDFFQKGQFLLSAKNI
jgi:hypothetical protein